MFILSMFWSFHCFIFNDNTYKLSIQPRLERTSSQLMNLYLSYQYEFMMSLCVYMHICYELPNYNRCCPDILGQLFMKQIICGKSWVAFITFMKNSNFGTIAGVEWIVQRSQNPSQSTKNPVRNACISNLEYLNFAKIFFSC